MRRTNTMNEKKQYDELEERTRPTRRTNTMNEKNEHDEHASEN